MRNKSRIYGEKRVVVAMLDSQFTNMKQHSNVLHRRVQEQVEAAEMAKKLAKLSNDNLLCAIAYNVPFILNIIVSWVSVVF